MEPEFDSRPDTYAHIQLVGRYLGVMIRALVGRAEAHDQSKLIEPELSAFNLLVQNLALCEYGSDQYHAALKANAPAVAHHYAANSHHPEHYPDGIRGMNLLDILEMTADWEAAAQRKDGHARASLDYQQTRFGFSDELKAIILNTLDLIDPPGKDASHEQ